jgi:putative ABC transport system substrate-binding protein
MIGRREFITLLGGAATWPLAARAQQGERMRRVGVLMGTAESDPDQNALVVRLTQTMAELGWKEGSNIHFEYRWAAGDVSRLWAHASELARLAPDAIFVQGTPGTIALRQSAPTTPLVFVMVTDPISSGLVSSLAQPAGNITGFTNYEFSMGGKWLAILKELAPSIRRVAVIHNPDNPALTGGQLRAIEAAGPSLDIQVTGGPVRSVKEIEQTISALAGAANGGFLVLADYLTLAHRKLIVELAAHHRLPAGYNLLAFAASGGLVSYGVDPGDLFRRAASYIDRILKGGRPSDLPIQQPTKFSLIINLNTAKALGLTVPLTLQASADEVIE